MGLWEKEEEDLSPFPLSGGEWQAVFEEARRQTVTGIVYRGLCRLPDEWLPPQPLLLRWVAEADGIERRNKTMNRVLAGLHASFACHGFDVVLLKGQGVAHFYEEPLLRQCGDIDFYFPHPAESGRAAELMRQGGATTRREADGSIHYAWHHIDVEHHVRLFDLTDPFLQRYLAAMEGQWGYRKLRIACREDEEIKIPAPLLNLLLLNTHIMKHAFGWGIGLRQLCDMARAYYCLHAEVEGEELKRLYIRTGIRKWSRMLHTFLTEYVGLPASAIPYDDGYLSARPLLDIVRTGGNFGQARTGRSHGSQASWQRKLYTSQSFLRNARFSCKYAPKEAFWTFTGLLAGQFKRL